MRNFARVAGRSAFAGWASLDPAGCYSLPHCPPQEGAFALPNKLSYRGSALLGGGRESRWSKMLSTLEAAGSSAKVMLPPCLSPAAAVARRSGSSVRFFW